MQNVDTSAESAMAEVSESFDELYRQNLERALAIQDKYESTELYEYGEPLTDISRDEVITLDIGFDPTEKGMENYSDIVALYQDADLTHKVLNYYDWDKETGQIRIKPPKYQLLNISNYGLSENEPGEFPMHYPYHHYLVPAVMLTAVYRLQGETEEALGAALEEAKKRALNVLKGFCGLYGDCGAAVGLGIFMSILTGTTPHSEETWAMTNRITAGSLMKIAEIDGPRCCKRNCFLALQYAVPFLKETLDITLEAPEEIECTFSTVNEDCKGDACPFFRM